MAQPSDSAGFRKRQYADENGAYVLPNDAIEHDRLDTQSNVLVTMMHGQPFHAPLSDHPPKKILDIGCGTGAMTHLLAAAFPDAEVIGLDISPVPESRHEKPPNLTYVQGNIMTLSGETDPRFAEGSFDYVFHRLLVLGLTDWPGYVAKVAKLLAPGGWAEMQDYSLEILGQEGQNVDGGWWSWSCLSEDARALGFDMDAGLKLATLMNGVGLVDVQEKIYDVPCCYSDDLDEDWKPVARYMQGLMIRDGFARALWTRVCGGRREEEELERMIQEADKVYKTLKAGDHSKLGVAWGRKGE